MPTNNPKHLEHVRKSLCCACGKANYIHEDGEPRVEAHHVQEKGMGNANGGDDWFNVIPLCTDCHTQADYSFHRNRKKFFQKFPHVWAWLRILGWKSLRTGETVKLYHPAYVALKPKEKQPAWSVQVGDIYPFIKNFKIINRSQGGSI